MIPTSLANHYCSVTRLTSSEMVHFCPRLNNCFCCLSLHTGSIILGGIGTLFSFYGFSAALWRLLSFKHDSNENPSPNTFIMWDIVIQSVSVLIQLLLMLGIFINSPKYLLPMLWSEGVLIIIGYLVFAFLLFTDPYLSLFVMNISKYQIFFPSSLDIYDQHLIDHFFSFQWYSFRTTGGLFSRCINI